jgi:hypothetical protein
MYATSTRRRLRLPLAVVPWNPDDDEVEIDPMLRPRPVLVPPATVSTVIPSPAIGPPPIAVNRSRPQRIPTLPGEELAAEQQYGQAVDAFRPQPRGWKSRLAFAGLNALAGLGQGGIGGAIGGGLASLGIAAVDPTVPDKFWKYRTQAESEGRLQRLRGQRRGDLQDRLLESQVIENEAQAEASRRPRPPKLVETVLADGTTVLTPESEGVVTGRPKPRGLLDNAKSVATETGDEIFVDDTGSPIIDPRTGQPFYSKRNRPTVEKPDDAPFTNKQLQSVIKEAETEREGIRRTLFVDKSIPMTLPGTVYDDGSQELPKPNPAYNDLMTRYRALDDDIRNWKLQMKPERPRTSGRTWSTGRWAAANPNGDVNAAKAQARRQGLTVID